MSKAWYGALMGLGQGISGYGDALTKNALAVQADERASARQRERDERESIRQQSLQEIRQQFQRDMANEAYLQKQVGVEDERRYQQDMLNPETDVGRLAEDAKQRELDRQIELRKTPYGGADSSGLLGALNPRDYTPESLTPYMKEVKRLVEEEGMSMKEAGTIAASQFPLEKAPKEQSTGAVQNTVVDDVNEVLKNAQKDSKEFIVKDMASVGIGTQEELEKLSKDELLKMYKEWLYEYFSPRLMDGPPVGNNQKQDRFDPAKIL